MVTPEEKVNQGEEVNLTQLFAEKTDLGAYEFLYGPLEELSRGDLRVLYRTGKNGVGVQFAVVLGTKMSDVQEREGNQFVTVDRISQEAQGEVAALLRQQGVKGKIDFL